MICFSNDASNVAMSNSIENITLNTGKGNPGAIGIKYFANNSGYVNNVTVKSGDGSGYAGFVIDNEINSAGYIKNLTVEGFKFGVRVLPMRHYATFENISLINQQRTGFYIQNTVVSIRNMHSENKCTALSVEGPQGYGILLDSSLNNGDALNVGIDNKCGDVFIRNVDVNGYGKALSNHSKSIEAEGHIDEFLSGDCTVAFETEKASLNLPIETFDDNKWDNNFENYAIVEDYGAVGDGVTDDTKAIQNALNSGKENVFFNSKTYFVSDSLTVPSNVKRINFMYGGLIPGDKLKEKKNTGILKIVGESEEPIIIEKAFNWIKFKGFAYFIDHASKRTLCLKNTQSQSGLMYFNSVAGGKVFIDDCSSVVDSDDRLFPPFNFDRQQVWARNINPERAFCQILNNGGSLWIFGFKTEGYSTYGTSFKTINGGKTEIFGGTVSIGGNKEMPVVENVESDTSLICVTNGYSENDIFPIVVEETQNGEKRKLLNESFPNRFLRYYKVPLYVGRKKI